jgi:hypothetical protein
MKEEYASINKGFMSIAIKNSEGAKRFTQAEF